MEFQAEGIAYADGLVIEDWKALGKAGKSCGAQVRTLWVDRAWRLEEMRSKSRIRPTGQGLTCQHEDLDCGWQAVGGHGKFLSRREAGPIESQLLGTGQTIERKSVSPGGSA